MSLPLVIQLLHSSHGTWELCLSCFICDLLLSVLCPPEIAASGQTFAVATPAIDRSCAALPQHWEGSDQIPQQLLEILTAHLMHNNL